MIGRVFKELRYIEQWGSGILNAIGECKKMGLPEPIFEEFAFRFRARDCHRNRLLMKLD